MGKENSTGKEEALTFLLGFLVCSQCTYLPGELGALQKGCHCLPCCHLSTRPCPGSGAALPGQGEQGSWGTLCPSLPVPTSPSPASGQGMAARPLCDHWTTPPPPSPHPSVQSEAVPALLPCPVVLCETGTGTGCALQGQGCALNPAGTGMCCAPCVGQVHQNLTSKSSATALL